MPVFQFKRGTQADHDNYIGEPGEITVISDDNYRPVVHDGATSGGHPLAFESELGGDGGSSAAFVRDFESGDLSNWTADSNFSVQSSVALEGSYSLYYNGTNTQNFQSAMTTVSADTYTKFSWDWRVESFHGSTVRPQVRLRNSGTRGMLVGIDTTGEIMTYDGSGYVGTGITISTATHYTVHIENVDYGTETFDVSVDDSGGSQVGSSSGHSFWNSIASVDEFVFVAEDEEMYGDYVVGEL